MCLCYNPVQFSHCHGASICTSEHQKHILARNNFPRTTETLPGSDCLYTPCIFCCWIRTSWHLLWRRHCRNITAMTVFWRTFQQYFARLCCKDQAVCSRALRTIFTCSGCVLWKTLVKMSNPSSMVNVQCGLCMSRWEGAESRGACYGGPWLAPGVHGPAHGEWPWVR